VRSPVGLCIGARSHEEIAVAVVGELISVRRTGVDAAAAWKQRRRSQAVLEPSDEAPVDLDGGPEPDSPPAGVEPRASGRLVSPVP
jgi:hypothetical protein